MVALMTNPESRISLVALGDSVTVGVGDAVPEGYQPGCAAHVAVCLSARFTSLARNGARARDVVLEQLPRALELRPDVATLLVGGNDVLRGDFDPAVVAAQVRTTCIELTAIGTKVVVVLLHDPERVLPKGGWVLGRVISVRAGLVSRAVGQALADVAGVSVVDPRQDPESTDPATWFVDRMHPSPVGHRYIANRVASEFARIGFRRLAPAPPVTTDAPGPVKQFVWLIIAGVPWFLKRSIDLVPELIRVVISEREMWRTPSLPAAEHSRTSLPA